MKAMSERCRFLDWDSQFFGLRIGRLEGNRLSPNEVPAVTRWCAEEQIDCLYFLADSRDPETIETTEAAGFGLKDLRMTYEWKSSLGALGIRPQIGERVAVRAFHEADLAALVPIARTAHTDSRFFFDRRFDRAAAALLYETWLRNACTGAHVLVGEAGGIPAGYLSCELSGDGEGQIGLVAVAPQFHGQGLGRAMIEAALRWFSERGATSIRVVTQGRNVAAHRFYQSAGFLTKGLESWHHRWSPREPAAR
jgi:dTDP-4-amino-4,6-dideoxy-D-galactose acyltransferase